MLLGRPRLFSKAHAATCSFTVTNVAFGSDDVTANAAVDTTATVSITCSGLALLTVQVCVNLGVGSGGATNAANRFMLSGSNKLTHSLYSDAARSMVWGSNLWAGAGPVSINVPLLLGTNTVTQTFHGRVFAGQQTVPAGILYSSTFTGMDAEIKYGGLGLGLSCSLLPRSATTTFNVTATVPPTCSIATNNLNFGTAGVLTANTDATTTLSPACTIGAPYNVGLNAGNGSGATVTNRKMTSGSGATVSYSLYQNSGRTTNRGNTVGTGTISGTGTGNSQTLTVYGRVPSQTTPAPAAYNDTIVVTLTY